MASRAAKKSTPDQMPLMEIEGYKVTRATINFGGEVPLPLDSALIRDMSYRGDVEFVIKGRITGNAFAAKGDEDIKRVVVMVTEVATAAETFQTKAAQTEERKRKAKEAANVVEEPKKRGRPAKAKDEVAGKDVFNPDNFNAVDDEASNVTPFPTASSEDMGELDEG